MDYLKVIAVGNTTRAAELKRSAKGTSYTRFGLAVKSRGGTIFFEVTSFGKQAEVAAQYVKKARSIELGKDGRMSLTADRIVFGGRSSQAKPLPVPDEQPTETEAPVSEPEVMS